MTDLILEVIAQNIEINITLFCTFILQYTYDNEKNSEILQDNSNENGRKKAFMTSRSWICTLLKEISILYRDITNDTGEFIYHVI